MKIAFGDFSGWDFHAASVDTRPMGGSQSAACYLARALALDGHEVYLIGSPSEPGTYAGVESLSWSRTNAGVLRALKLDLLVCNVSPGRGETLRRMLGPDTRLVLWNHHAHDQPAVRPLVDENVRAAYDGFAMVSEWQRTQYHQTFGIDLARTAVMRNAMAPAFERQFAADESVLAHKSNPPVLAYTSTPFRGLDMLLDAFGSIQKQVPGARLRVFSSMKVYQASAAEDEAAYGALYERCRRTTGVEYVGSLPQPELARELRSVAVLAYPNSFPETSCIGVMEALASGCSVVTSRLAALPETCAGFARLVPVGRGRAAYVEQFVAETVRTLRDFASERAATDARLRRQVDHVNQTTTWATRAREWIAWSESLTVPR